MYRVEHSLFGVLKMKSNSSKEVEDFLISEVVDDITYIMSSVFTRSRSNILISKKYITRLIIDSKSKFRKITLNKKDVTSEFLTIAEYKQGLYKDVFLVNENDGDRCMFGRMPTYHIDQTQEDVIKTHVDFEVGSVEYGDAVKGGSSTGGIMVFFNEEQMSRIFKGIYKHPRTQRLNLEGRDKCTK